MKTALLTSLPCGLRQNNAAGFFPSETDWVKPDSWPELRHITPTGAISLLVCDKYPNLSFSVSCQGGYKVSVNGATYGIYGNNEDCSVDISSLPQNSAFLINYPEALSAYVITISPRDNNYHLKIFKCIHSGENTVCEQGILWAHTNLDTILDRIAFANDNDTIKNSLLAAVTTSQKDLKVKSIYAAFQSCSSLKYVPPINYEQSFSKNYRTFKKCGQIRKVILRNLKPDDLIETFAETSNLESLVLENPDFSLLNYAAYFLSYCEKLKPLRLDFSSATNLKELSCFGNASRPIRGLKGIVVSPQALFSELPPQINISYSGLDREALVELFQSLPQVYKGQKIKITGVSGCNDLTPADLAIATAKGWEIMQ